MIVSKLIFILTIVDLIKIKDELSKKYKYI